MKKEVGLWIDHRAAVIVLNHDQQAEIKRITSHMEKRVRYSGASHHDTTEDGRDRRFDNQLDQYYDEVFTYLRDADSILILGPGKGKTELQTCMEVHGLSERIVAIKPADKMTDDQIVEAVRQHFQESKPDSNRTLHQQKKANIDEVQHEYHLALNLNGQKRSIVQLRNY